MTTRLLVALVVASHLLAGCNGGDIGAGVRGAPDDDPGDPGDPGEDPAPGPDDPDDPVPEPDGPEATCAVAPLEGQSPFGGAPIVLPGTIEAEDYDRGGAGVAYDDHTAGNEGGVHRDDDVDLKAIDGGFAIGWWEEDEWVAYTVAPTRAGRYRLELRAGTVEEGRTLRVEACGEVVGDAAVPHVAEWGQLGTVTVDDVALSAGPQTLKLVLSGGDWADLDRITATALDLEPEPEPEPEPDPGPVSEGFAAVIDGIRPRGPQCDSYGPSAPTSGTELFVATDGDDRAAGTSQAPFRTIAHAAVVAEAGDVVTIRAGEYDEAVTVESSGTEADPIVFQAEECGTVVLSGGGRERVWKGAGNNQMYGVSWTTCETLWVTLKGLVFRDYADRVGDPDECHGTTIAAALCTGWRVEDCRFERAADRAIAAYGSDIVVERTTIIDAGGYSVIGAGEPENHIADLVFRDLILQGGNSDELLGPGCGASVKILYSDRVTVENIESYENVGPGWWFDWENYDWIIRDSYFHDDRGRGYSWEGGGVWIEGPGGGGTFTNNVLTGNEGASLAIMESHGHTIEGNLFVEDGVELRGIVGGGRSVPTGLTIRGNSFKRCGVYTSIGGWDGTTPAGQGITMDRDTFELGGGPILTWGDLVANDVAEAQSVFGFEFAGTESDIAWPPE